MMDVRQDAQGSAGMILISDDGIYTRTEAMQYLRLKPATFSKLTNGKLKGVHRLDCMRFGRLQRFRGSALKKFAAALEEMCKLGR